LPRARQAAGRRAAREIGQGRADVVDPEHQAGEVGVGGQRVEAAANARSGSVSSPPVQEYVSSSPNAGQVITPRCGLLGGEVGAGAGASYGPGRLRFSTTFFTNVIGSPRPVSAAPPTLAGALVPALAAPPAGAAHGSSAAGGGGGGAHRGGASDEHAADQSDATRRSERRRREGAMAPAA
jgi:hypothetical protein